MPLQKLVTLKKPWKPFSLFFQALEASFGKSSKPWKHVLPFFHGMEASFPWRGSFAFKPPAGPVAAWFSSHGFSKHWKPVSAFFQGLEACFAKVSRHWRHVLGFLQTLEEGLGKCSKGWRLVSAKDQRLEGFSPDLGEFPCAQSHYPRWASRGLLASCRVFQTLEASFGNFPRVGSGFREKFQGLEAGFGRGSGGVRRKNAGGRLTWWRKGL